MLVTKIFPGREDARIFAKQIKGGTEIITNGLKYIKVDPSSWQDGCNTMFLCTMDGTLKQATEIFVIKDR